MINSLSGSIVASFLLVVRIVHLGCVQNELMLWGVVVMFRDLCAPRLTVYKSRLSLEVLDFGGRKL